MRSRLIFTFVAVAALAFTGRAVAAVSAVESSNWAGYVASKTGLRFQRVTAFWDVPAATCTPGRSSYSAVWVGLGGYHTASKALEQLGTESDCRASGTPTYSSWYELVPDGAHSATLHVRPGDQMAASVVVSGHDVRLRLVDVTRATSFVKHVRVSQVDTTSADWIVEAPSACTIDDRCRTLPLANFGTVGFAAANATTAGGHKGTLTDSTWSLHALDLGAFERATPGVLDVTGDAFAVTYGAT